MIRTVSDNLGYKKLMAILSVLTVAAGLAVAAVGEILLPVASALCAALFVFEDPKSRILSYVIPASSLALSCVIFGLYALTSVQFIIVGLILAICYALGLKKAETSVYLTLAIFVFLIIGLYISGVRATESFSFEAISEYYKEVAATFKEGIFNILTSEKSPVTVTAEVGTEIDELAIREYIDSFVNMLPAFFAVLAFALAGFTVKLFVFIMLKSSKHGILKRFAHFVPSSLVSYIYVVISILAMFSADESIFSLALVNASQFLMFVFAYIGLQYVIALGNMSGRRGLFIGVTIAAFILYPQGAVQILSYLGAWFCISLGKEAAGDQ